MNAAGELTFYDLLKDFAERVGVRDWGTGADNRITVPADPATRDRLVRAINAGRRELYSRLPEARCFTPIISVTLDPTGTSVQNIDGDASKYRLPYTVQSLAGGQWAWKTGDAESDWGGILRQAHQADLMALYASTGTAILTGPPNVIALVQNVLSGPNEPARRTASFLWIYPKPEQTYVVQGQARIMYSPLSEDSDLEPMGQEHAESLLTFAERAWNIGQCDADQWAILEQRAAAAVAISQSLDNNRGAQNLGIGIDPDAERDRLKYRYGRSVPERWSQVDNVSGINVL